MPLNPDLSIAAQTPFTPGERAVLVERAETLKVNLDAFIKAAKDEDSQNLVEALIPCAQEYDGIKSIVGDKLHRTIIDGITESLKP